MRSCDVCLGRRYACTSRVEIDAFSVTGDIENTPKAEKVGKRAHSGRPRNSNIMTARKHPLDRYLSTLGEGTVTWIGVRPRRREPLTSLSAARAVFDQGLEGDHRMVKAPGSGRQVTLISEEFIRQIAAQLGAQTLDPARLRRNIVVSGFNLNALRRQRFWVGNALLEATQLCHPCARMEAALGEGAVLAMYGYGGLCAKIIEGGDIEVGAGVRWAPPS